MSDFTDFFPAAAGGGGFTKRLKWTTARGLNDANYNNAASYTVNPATDLGLSDGDSIGYMLVGAGYNDAAFGAKGGKIIYGTAIITNASTNLNLTPGVANGGNTTISGGLTLTSGDGSTMSGAGDFTTYGSTLAAGSGIMGYGAGGGGSNTNIRNNGSNFHGWGGGAFPGYDGGDGAILLYY